ENMAKSGSHTGISHLSAGWSPWSGIRKSGNRFSARIPLQALRIDHFHDFGLSQFKIIAI
ncbi:MAG: hypothetical protein WCA96_02505, partial [Methylocella sp.]